MRDLAGVVRFQTVLQIFREANVEMFLATFALQNIDVEKVHGCFPISQLACRAVRLHVVSARQVARLSVVEPARLRRRRSFWLAESKLEARRLIAGLGPPTHFVLPPSFHFGATGRRGSLRSTLWKNWPAIRSSELLTRESSFAEATEDTILRSESPEVSSERRMVRAAGFEPATPSV
jgi:hypothetical protein